MDSFMLIDKSQAKGLANRIIRSMDNSTNDTLFLNEPSSYRRKCKKLVNFCKNDNWAMLIGEKSSNTKHWQIAWGEWSLSEVGDEEKGEFTKCCIFRVQIIQSKSYVIDFNVIISKHALIRMIMRCGEVLVNSYDFKSFMNSRIKDVVIASMGLMEQFFENIPLEGSEHGWIIINNEFYPLSLEIMNTWKGDKQINFILKTYMKDDYESVKKTKAKSSALSTQKEFFSFSNGFHKFSI